MPAEYIPDNLISVVDRIVNDRLKYFAKYTGIVKKLKDDGIITCHMPDFGTSEDDPGTWLDVLPGNFNYSFLQPEIGQQVEVYFMDNNPSRPRYSHLNAITAEIPSTTTNRFYPFHKGNNQVYLDSSNNKLVIRSGTAEIEITEDTKIEIKVGSTGIEKTPLGETLKAELDQLKTDFNNFISTVYNVHSHATAAPGAPSPPSLPGSSTSADFSNILSTKVKNN